MLLSLSAAAADSQGGSALLGMLGVPGGGTPRHPTCPGGVCNHLASIDPATGQVSAKPSAMPDYHFIQGMQATDGAGYSYSIAIDPNATTTPHGASRSTARPRSTMPTRAPLQQCSQSDRFRSAAEECA